MVAVKWFVLVLSLVVMAAAQDYDQNKFTIRLLLSRFEKEHLVDAIDQKKAKLLYGYILQPGSSYKAEIGILMNPGTDSEEFIVVGELSNQLPGQDGSSFPYQNAVYYIADKNGYRAKVNLSKSEFSGFAGYGASRALLINLAG